MKHYFQTGNDVLDFNRYYKGKEEPPLFRKQFIDLKDKIFIPIDDLGLLKLSKSQESEVILHQFVKDSRQNKFVINKKPPLDLFQKVYAVTSSDLSVDSANSYDIFNLGNILKARINAFRLQNEFDLLVILTLIWGEESTFKYAFENIEKGSVVAVSSQAIENIEIFRKGFIQAVKLIEPDYICWYGKVFDWVSDYYDTSKIIQMQTRTQLIHRKLMLERFKGQIDLFSA